jgi:ABC-2 type transport system permease protein
MDLANIALGCRKPLAFVRKDFIAASSYKLSFIMQLLNIILSVAVFFFMAKLFGSAIIPHLKPYGGDYFSFVLIGVAFSDYLGIALGSMAGTIRGGQVMGTLEALLVTQTEIPTIVISSSLYSFIWTSIRVIAYLAVGAWGFNMNIQSANYGGALLILLLTIIAFSSMGIISASFIMVLKRGDPISWVFTNLSWLLGGLYYPISVLPEWLQKLSYLLPITYALEGMRLALLKGYSIAQLSNTILALLIFSAIMLPISILCFKYAVKRAKIDGSLTQY